MQLPERLSGAIHEHLVGDALGVPYESMPAAQVPEIIWRGHGTHDQPPGTWSDDGSLMLALLDSALPEQPGTAPRFDPQDQGQRALAWRRLGAYAPSGIVFDIGNATRGAFDRIEQGTPAAQAGATDALGNGSLMRILPLALVMRDAPDGELARLAGRASNVTHGSPEARLACALCSLLVRRLLAPQADRPEALVDAIAVVRWAPPEGTTSSDHEAFLGWPGRAGRSRVVDSFWSAWDAFAGAADYRETVVRAVEHGEDRDTTAAIAGGLAGTFWGIDAIPADWLAGLRDLHIPRALIDRLIETDGWRTSSGDPLRLDMLDLSGLSALEGSGWRVGLTLLPGKQLDGGMGRHWRDLELDARRMRRHYGASDLALLVEDEELQMSRATHIGEVMRAHGTELLRFPIDDDHGEPRDLDAYRDLVRESVERVRRGETVAIACRGGLDRTGMTAGCLLREAGAEMEDAIHRVHRARRYTLTRPNQQQLVRMWRTADP